jgi:hypothetical protein
MSKNEEVVPRYISPSPHYWEDHVEFEQKVYNFEPLIHHVVEQEVTTQGIRMSRGVELLLITK